MILNCPSCIAQFYVEDDLLGPSGRKVKCSSCGVTWMQMPEVDNSSDDETDLDVQASKGDSQDINIEKEDNGSVEGGFSGGDDGGDAAAIDDAPAVEDDDIDVALERAIERLEEGINDAGDATSVGSVVQGQGVASGADEEGYRPSGFTTALEENANREKKLYGYMSAVGVFLLIFCGLFLFSSSMLSAYPSTQAFYGLFGVRADIPGEGLGFDKVNVVTDGSVTHVTGRVVNYGSDEVRLPSIVAVVRDSHEELVYEHIIDLSSDILPGQAVLSFDEYVENEHLSTKDNYSMSLRFAMDYEMSSLADVKTGEAGDESSQAHHQSESDHQSGHVGSEESHQPASSDAHPEPSHQNSHSSH